MPSRKPRPVTDGAATDKGVDPLPRVTRPTIIDPADGPCEICAAHKAGTCDRCGATEFFRETTDHTRHMGDNGFQSVKPSHFHLAPVLGVSGRESRFDELCIDCYRKDYTAVYDTEPPL